MSPHDKDKFREHEDEKWTLNEAILPRIFAKFPDTEAEEVAKQLCYELQNICNMAGKDEAIKDVLIPAPREPHLELGSSMMLWSPQPPPPLGNQFGVDTDTNPFALFPLVGEFESINSLLESVVPVEDSSGEIPQLLPGTQDFDAIQMELSSQTWPVATLSSENFPQYPMTSPQSPQIQYATYL